jgi:hypothetical protein
MVKIDQTATPLLFWPSALYNSRKRRFLRFIRSLMVEPDRKAPNGSIHASFPEFADVPSYRDCGLSSGPEVTWVTCDILKWGYHQKYWKNLM